jgi:hypothetical protein
MADERPALASARPVPYTKLVDEVTQNTAGSQATPVLQQTPPIAASETAPAGVAEPEQHAPEELQGGSAGPPGSQLQREGVSPLPRAQRAPARPAAMRPGVAAGSAPTDRPLAEASTSGEPAQQADRFEKLYDATRKRLRHVEEKLLQHKSAHRALERVCEDLRTRLAQAEEHAVRARERDAAVLAREAAVAALAEAKADAELLRARLAAREAATAIAEDEERRARALDARVADLERQLDERDRLLRDRDAERTHLCALIARYEKELQARENSRIGRPSAVGRSRRLEPKEDPTDHSARPHRPDLRHSTSGAANTGRAFLELDDTEGDCLVATPGGFQARSLLLDPDRSDLDETRSQQAQIGYEESLMRQQHGLHFRAETQSRWLAEQRVGLLDADVLPTPGPFRRFASVRNMCMAASSIRIVHLHLHETNTMDAF